MTPQSTAISLAPTSLGLVGLELAGWNLRGGVRPTYVNRKYAVVRRDEIVMG